MQEDRKEYFKTQIKKETDKHTHEEKIKNITQKQDITKRSFRSTQTNTELISSILLYLET